MHRGALVGAPFYSLTKYAGMGEGPRAFRRAGISNALGPSEDQGDAAIPPLTQDSMESGAKNFRHFVSSSEKIRQKVASIDNDTYFILGGECSVVVGTMAGLREKLKGKPGMLWMDAHGDFNTPESSPSGYIGGMCLAMACGRGPRMSTDVDGGRSLVSEDRLVHLGSRALDPPELSAFNQSPALLFSARKVRKAGAAAAAAEAARRLEDRADWVICHLDVDVIDPSEVPAVNYPEPGGLRASEVVSVVRALRKTGKLTVFELTSYNSSKDPSGSSARAIVDAVREVFGN